MSDVQVTCPCGRQFNVQLGTARATFVCDQCGQTLQLPAAGEVASSSGAAAQPAPVTPQPIQQPAPRQPHAPSTPRQVQRQQPMPRQELNWKLIGAITGGVAGVFLIGLIVYMVSGGDDNSVTADSTADASVTPWDNFAGDASTNNSAAASTNSGTNLSATTPVPGQISPTGQLNTEQTVRESYGRPIVDPGKIYPGLGEKPIFTGGNRVDRFVAGEQPYVISYNHQSHAFRFTNLLNDDEAFEVRASSIGTPIVSPGLKRLIRGPHGKTQSFHGSNEVFTIQAGESLGIAETELRQFRSVRWREFIDDNNLLAGGYQHLTRWSLPEGTPVFQKKAVGLILGLTPGRRYVMEIDRVGRTNIHFIDVNNGMRVGTLTGKLKPSPDGWAMTRDGRLLALNGKMFDLDYVAIRDLVTGQEIMTAVLPEKVDKVAWLNDDYLLCGNWIVSVRKQAAVQKLELVYPTTGLDGRAWICSGKPSVTKHLDVIGTDTLADLDQRPPLGKEVLKRGDTVEFVFKFEGDPPPEDAKQKITTAVKQAAQQSGLRLIDYREDYAPKPELRPILNPAAAKLIVAAGGTVVFRDGGQFELVPLPDRKVLAAVIRNKPTAGTRRLKHAGQTIELPGTILSVDLGLTVGKTRWRHQRQIRDHEMDLDALIRQGGTFNEQQVVDERWNMVVKDINATGIPGSLRSFDDHIRGVVARSRFDPASLAGRAPKVIAAPDSKPRTPNVQLPPVAKAVRLVKPAPRVWNVSPDPTIGDLNTGFLKKAIKLGVAEYGGGARFSGINAGQAVVMTVEPLDHARLRESSGSEFTDAVTKRPRTMHRCDLRASKIIASTAVPPNSLVLDVRADARVVVTYDRDGKKLQIWKCGADKDEVYTEIPDRLNRTASRDVYAAHFVGDRQLLVHDQQGLVMYKMPDAEVVYEQEFPWQPVLLSPNQKYFVGKDEDGQLALFHVSDGTLAGQLEVRQTSFQTHSRGIGPGAAAFHPNGQILALQHGRQIGLWDMNSGEFIKVLPGSVVGQLRWTSEIHLLAGRMLIDTQQELPAWSYSTDGVPESPDGAIYYCDDDREDVLHFCAAMAPSAAVTRTLQRIGSTVRLKPEEIGIRVDIDFEHPRNSELEAAVRAWMEKRMAAQNQDVNPTVMPYLEVKFERPDQRRTYLVDVDGAEKTVIGNSMRAVVRFSSAPPPRSPFWIKGVWAMNEDVADQFSGAGGNLEEQMLWLQSQLLLQKIDKLDLPLWGIYSNSSTGFGRSQLSYQGEELRVEQKYQTTR